MGLRVKKLEWNKRERHHESWAEIWGTPDGANWAYNVRKYAIDGRVVFCGYATIDGEDSAFEKRCNSIEHGKQLAQEHWESQEGIGKYLEEETE